MPVYQYKISLEETEDGLKPVYGCPEENRYEEYKQGEKLVVAGAKATPQFHRDTERVGVNVLTDFDVE